MLFFDPLYGPSIVSSVLETTVEGLACVMTLDSAFGCLGTFILSFLSFSTVPVCEGLDEALLCEFDRSSLVAALLLLEVFDRLLVFDCVLSSTFRPSPFNAVSTSSRSFEAILDFFFLLEKEANASGEVMAWECIDVAELRGLCCWQEATEDILCLDEGLDDVKSVEA